jgi:hypothetical protein
MKLHTHLFLVVCGVALFSCGGQQDAPQPAAVAPAATPAPAPVVEEKPQTKEERIQEIKLWYAQAKKNVSLNCTKVKVPKNDNVDESICNRCVINDSIVVISITDIIGDGAMGFDYYYFNGKLFCFEEDSESSGYIETTTLFYSENGELVYASETLQDDWDNKSFKDREVKKIEGYSKSHLIFLELANNVLLKK